MGYLVYCPTCGGKMSNHAERCPHCAETAFFIRRQRTVYTDEPCDVSNVLKWSSCNGRGWYFRQSVEIGMCLYSFAGEDTSLIVRLRDGSDYHFSRESLRDAKVSDAIRTGRYAVEAWGSAVNRCWTFHYDRVSCPRCGGRGTVRVPKTLIRWEDVRQPVE